MRTIIEIADIASIRYDMDHAAAEAAALAYLRQIEEYDDRIYDYDAIPDEVAEFTLGSIKAGIDTTPPTELGDASHNAELVADSELETTHRRHALHQSILAAADAGHGRSDIAKAVQLSVPSVDKILRGMREGR